MPDVAILRVPVTAKDAEKGMKDFREALSKTRTKSKKKPRTKKPRTK